RLTFTLPVIEATGRLKLHIEGAEKKDVLARALADGPTAELPVRAVLRSQTPLTLYWAP
ncbi:MAG: 6-phosphogluconolactonase, partial [Aestuariivirga sp.]